MTVLLIALLAAPSLAEYPTPEQAGFHHCMLIYDAATRDAAGMMPFVTHLSKRDRPTEWLFDAFLFCAQGSGPSTEASYMNGPTNQADWQAMLEPWFSPEHGFPALQAAVDQAETRLGPIPKPLQIIITIPYPSISQTDFGDVDGDGVSEDLTDADDFTEAISWYLDLATRRFDEADLPDLELWGFYWTWEGIAGADGANALLTSEIVHERGRRLLWIPWYRASGWESWRDFGFDVAIMQPNYAFLTYHRDAIRNDRLVDNAEAARAHGLGVEMETGYAPDTNARTREIFRDYMAFGAAEICGYQHAATAYFQSFGVFPKLHDAADRDARRTYHRIAGYVRGNSQPRPGRLRRATVTRGTDRAPELVDNHFVTERDSADGAVPVGDTTLTLRFPRPRDIGTLDVSVLRHADDTWIGALHAQALDRHGEAVGSGWRRAIVSPVSDRSFKTVLALPLNARRARSVSLRVAPSREQSPLLIDEISSAIRLSTLGDDHLAVGTHYRVAPATPQQYPDRGGQLTDGIVATRGWSQGESVGWQGQRDVTVFLDLGEARPIDKCVVHCDGGGVGAVYFPNEVVADLSLDPSVAASESVGGGAPPPAPVATLWATDDAVVVDWGKVPDGGEGSASGHIDIVPDGGPITARYVALRFAPHNWLMVSEIKVYSSGENVALGAEYYARPLPTAESDTHHADDGRMLVDGHVTGGLVIGDVCGWMGVDAPSVTIDLGREQDLREITVHALGGGLYGARLPGKVLVDLPSDHDDYVEVAAAVAVDPGDDTCRNLPITIPLPDGSAGRHVRVRFEAIQGWLLLSEIEVR